MMIRLETFAILRELLHEEILDFEVPEGITASQLISRLEETFPDAEPILKVTRVAHSEDYLGKEELIRHGETYALIPPVSGG